MPSNHARIVRGKIASAADFHPAALQISGLVGDARADRIGIRFLSHQIHSQPVVLRCRRCCAASTGAPSLTETSTSTAPSLLKSPMAMPRAERDLAKTGPLCSLTFLNTLPRVLKEQQRLLVFHLGWRILRPGRPEIRWRETDPDCRRCRSQRISAPSRSSSGSPCRSRVGTAMSSKVSSWLF